MSSQFERYIEIATGLTSVTVQAAERIVQRLVKEGEVAADRAERTVADLIEASQRNRETIMELVREEVDRAVDKIGPVAGIDLADLEKRLFGRTAETDRSAAAGPGGTATDRPVKKSAAAKKSTAKKSATKKSTAKKSAAKKSAPAKKSAAKKSAKKSAAKKQGNTS